jgi:hypothetical protein
MTNSTNFTANIWAINNQYVGQEETAVQSMHSRLKQNPRRR